MANEIRVAIVTGLFAVGASAVGGTLGFIGGKSEYLEISKHHTAELERQHALLLEQFEIREKAMLLDFWRRQASQLHATRQALIEAFDPDPNSLNNLQGYVDAVVSAEKNFDPANFLRFLKDNASSSEEERFNHLMNEKSMALADLQKISAEALLSEAQRGEINGEARMRDIVAALNRDANASAAFVGYFTSSTLKSLAGERR